MREHGETTISLGEKLDVSDSTIGRWLSDKHKPRRPTDTMLRKLSPIVARSHGELMRMVGRLEVEIGQEDESEESQLIRDISAMLKGQPKADLVDFREYVEFRNHRRRLSFIRPNIHGVALTRRPAVASGARR